MSTSFTLPEEAKIVGALKPAADAAGRNGRYVTLKNALKAYIVFHIDQGNAATIALSIQQAQAIAGTGVKAITTARWWAALDLATSDALVRQADGATFTTDAGVKEKVIVAEVDPATLDVANGFDCIRANTGASNVANITQAAYELTPLRYPAATPPSAVVD
jgi:hypothetical protein